MGEVSLVSWPCILVSGLTFAVVGIMIRNSYIMGVESEFDGGINYQQAFWQLSCMLLVVSSIISMLKIIY